MFYLKILFSISIASLLAINLGCQQSTTDKLEGLRFAFEEMKTVSEEFLNIMGDVKDEASAKEALPKLRTTCESMFKMGQALDDVSKTNNLRSAISLKKEITEYRQAQKVKVDEEMRRIGEIPEAAEVLQPLLEEFGMF